MIPAQECLMYPVHKLYTSKRYRKYLETYFPNLVGFFPIQTAVTHTTLFNCTVFYCLVIIIGKIHPPPWNQFLELIFQNGFLWAWICRCVSAGIDNIFSADWSLWGLKVIHTPKKNQKPTQPFCIIIATRIWKCFELGFPQCMFSNIHGRWYYKKDKVIAQLESAQSSKVAQRHRPASVLTDIIRHAQISSPVSL